MPVRLVHVPVECPLRYGERIDQCGDERLAKASIQGENLSHLRQSYRRDYGHAIFICHTEATSGRSLGWEDTIHRKSQEGLDAEYV